ncbi:MAG: hypothetical protein L6R41_005221 [Letrouitia leprolyta]|nr:MAG: hypothetical protein L6R41_005221 [Letrouitia leprolyta]
MVRPDNNDSLDDALMHPIILSFLLFLVSISPSLEVTVVIRNIRNAGADSNEDPYYQTCRNLLPGECCSPIFRRGPRGEVEFSDLHDLEIAIVWRNEENPFYAIRSGCDGRVLAAHVGPSLPGGRWHLVWSSFLPLAGQIPAAGASYIRIPQSAPPKIEDGTSAWIGGTGIRALSFHGGSWFAKRDDAFRKQRRDSTLPGPETWQIVSSRSILMGGTVYYTNPPKGRYPDLIGVDGKNYTDDGRGDLRYQSANGVILNLTALDVDMRF